MSQPTRPSLRNHLIVFEVERTGELTTLFSDFDRKIEPFLKAEYDHGKRHRPCTRSKNHPESVKAFSFAGTIAIQV